MTELKKDNDYIVDRNGLAALGSSTNPPVPGAEVKLSDGNGGHVSGHWNGSQFLKSDKK